jgi:hypothetical protein
MSSPIDLGMSVYEMTKTNHAVRLILTQMMEKQATYKKSLERARTPKMKRMLESKIQEITKELQRIIDTNWVSDNEYNLVNFF